MQVWGGGEVGLHPHSNFCSLNFSVRPFSVTVRTTCSEAPEGIFASMSSVRFVLRFLFWAICNAGGSGFYNVAATMHRLRNEAVRKIMMRYVLGSMIRSPLGSPNGTSASELIS